MCAGLRACSRSIRRSFLLSARLCMPKTVTSSAGSLERRGLTDEQLVAMLRNMLLQRQLDNRGFQLNRQGKIPFALGSEGHEALQAGAAMAFVRGRDISSPYYRDLGLVLGVGITPLDMLLQHVRRGPTSRAAASFPTTTPRATAACCRSRSIIAGALPARRRCRVCDDKYGAKRPGGARARPAKVRRAKASGTRRSISPPCTSCRSSSW